MLRIVSLLPSTTEIACALGFRDALVGRSHECDFPPGVEALPACTEARIDTAAPSCEIDAQVRRFVRDALSIYRVDAERLRALAPDVILTQDQCEVCAASLADVEAAVAEWTGGTGRTPRLVSLRPARLDDVWGDIARVGEILGAADRARRLVAECTGRVEAVARRSRALAEGPRVACLEWIDPPMGAGNWMPELVALAGGEPLFGKAGEHSPGLDWEDLRAADPDVIAVLPCGFSLERTEREMAPLASRPGWEALRAVREGRVYLLEGNQYFNRPGPRLVESLEILAEVLHPGAFRFAHTAAAARRLTPGPV